MREGRTNGLRWLMTAQALSLLGDQLLGVALALYILDRSGSVLFSTASILASLLPGVLLGALAGAVADRFDRRRLLVLVSLTRALLVLPLLALTLGQASLGWVLLIVFVKSSVAQLIGPAVGASLPSVIQRRELPRANARLAATGVMLQLTAPALGALLYAAYGLTISVACNAVAYLLASMAWCGLPRTSTRPVVTQRVWRSSMAGIQLVRHDPLLSRLLVALTIGLVGVTMQSALLVPLVRLELHGSPASVGLLSSMQAIGALTAAVVFTRLNRRLGNLAVVAIGMCGLPATTIVLLLSHEVYQAFPGVVASGLLLTLLTSASQVHIQQSVPSAFLGRVLGIIGSTIAASAALGTAVALILSAWLDLRVMLVLAVLVELVGVAWYVGPVLVRRYLRP